MKRIALPVLIFLSICFAGTDSGGSGVFGKWIIDRYGLVAYQYEMDERSDPRAAWPRGKSVSNLHWHQLGNAHINAIGANHGFVQLFYNDSAQRWINSFDPENLNYAGGFGFVLEGDTAFSTYYPFQPRDTAMKRIFGQGYFEKEVEQNGMVVSETVFAPAGDVSALVMRAGIKNISGAKKDIYYFPYFNVSPFELRPFQGRAVNKAASKSIKLTPMASESMVVAASKKIWSKDGGFPPRAVARDQELPDVFFATLGAKAKLIAINDRRLFTATGWRGAQALKEVVSNPEGLLQKDAANSFGMMGVVEVSLKPGEEKLLHFAYGYAKAEKPEQVVAKIGDPEKAFQDTVDFWKGSRPGLVTDQDQFLARELEWDNYYLVSSFVYDAYYQRHFAPQGGHYLYVAGVNGADRDLSAYILTLIYYHPELAREMIELCLENQETSGRLFYDFEGYGRRYSVPFRPSDLSLWTLWAATEYVFATRDFGFLKKELPYWPKEKHETGTVLDHLNRAYSHLEHGVGTGARGLIKLKMSDWNDQMTLLVTKNDPLDFLITYFDGESTLNTAMACYILPMYSQLLKSAGEGGDAEKVDNFHRGLKSALQKQWLPAGWLPRAYSALGKSFGKKEMYLEPQVWALLSDDLLSQDQRIQLLDNIEAKLRKPSRLGMLISNATRGALFARPGEQERGGIWFAINGPGAVALAKYDPAMGWDELKKNTLHWHAQQYPELWFGVWSGPDSFNSVFSKNPGGTWYASDITGGPSQWPIQNNHSHSQLMYALAKLAGFHPNAEGFEINPMIPLESYRLDTGTLGMEKSPGRLAGYFKFDSSEGMMVTVKIPPGLGKNLLLRIDGKESAFQETEAGVKFPLAFTAGKKAQWELIEAGR